MSDITPLTPKQLDHQESQTAHEGYIHRNLVALDMEANVATGGHPDETISSRLARSAEEGHEFGKLGIEALNIFNHNHGPKAQAGDVERAKAVQRLEEDSTGFQK